MILKPSYALEPLYMRNYKVEIFGHIVLLRDIKLFIALFYLFQINFKVKLGISNETIIEIVLILFDSPPSQCTDKNLFSHVVV